LEVRVKYKKNFSKNRLMGEVKMTLKWSKYNIIYRDDLNGYILITNSITSITYKLSFDLYNEVDQFVKSKRDAILDDEIVKKLLHDFLPKVSS